MLGSDAAVDYANNYAFAIEARCSAQANFVVKKTEEVQTVVRCQRSDLVLPDTQDLGHAFKFVSLGRMHARREAIQAIQVVIDQPATCADASEDRILFCCKARSVALYGWTRLVKSCARQA